MASSGSSSRWQRWVIRLLAGFAVAIIPTIAFYFHGRYSVEREIQAVVAELDRTDPGWRLEDIEKNRRPVPAEENAALVVIAAHKLISAGWDRRLRQEDDDILAALGKLPPTRALSARQYELLRTELTPLQPAIAVARKLADMPWGRYSIAYAPNFIGTLMRDQQKLHNVVPLLQLDADRLLQEGKHEEAMTNIRAMLNAGRSLGDEPLMTSVLLRMRQQRMVLTTLERAVAQGELSESSLLAMQKALEEELAVPLFLIGMRGERGGMHMVFENVASGKILSSKEFGSGGNALTSWIEDVAAANTFRRAHARLLKHHTGMIEAAKLEGKARYVALAALSKEIDRLAADRSARKDFAIIILQVPAQARVANDEREADSRLACAIAALAAERLRLQRGHWPASLDELVQWKFLSTLPVDLSDDNPVRIRKEPTGLAIHCLNGQEFRLWDPGHRRQGAD